MSRFHPLTLILPTAFAATLVAQQAVAPPPPPPKPLTVTELGLFVYPAKGQTKDVQAKDEQACYAWAQQQTGITLVAGTPNTEAAGKAAGAKADEATQGAAVVGAAKGAVVGVAIGAIAGDAGTGAAIGAVAGAAGGRRAKKKAVAQAEQQGAAQASAANTQQVDTFKKALGACLEGKGYTVK
jgi:hypothetical protein